MGKCTGCPKNNSKKNSKKCSCSKTDVEPFVPPQITQAQAIERMASLDLNNKCTPDDCKITRKVFPGNVANGNIPIAYIEAGEKYKNSNPTIILISGNILVKETWVPVMRILCENKFHVIAYDHRGWGSSGKPELIAPNYSLRVLAIDLRELIAFTRVNNPILWGFSLATRIMLEYLRQSNTGRFAPSKLVFQNGTPSGNTGEFVFNYSPTQPPNLGQILVTQGQVAFLQAISDLVLTDVCCPEPINRLREFVFFSGMTSAGELQFVFANNSLRFNYADPLFLAKIKQPTLMITGNLDRLSNPRASFYMASYLGLNLNSSGQLDPTVPQQPATAEVVEIRGSNHVTHMTHICVMVERSLPFLLNTVDPCTVAVLKGDDIKVIKA